MKKMGFLLLVTMVALLFSVAFPASAAAPKAPVPAGPAVLVPAAAVAMPAEDPHPHIHQALESMRAAKHHLETAAHDFEGHRVKAIEHLDQAIKEAEICEGMKTK
ncbi:MAG TPA: hypothetical protein VFO39_19235 [Candidatus Sulfotelmatobacter sp.]|nr:hypothetical protein [Candidatus Sulfotelmatobacter sp.]